MTTRIVIVICVVVACLSLGVGIIIGYFVREGSTDLSLRDRRACGPGAGSNIPEINNYLQTCQAVACRAETCDISLPRNYVAYHLQGKTITVDGDINDPAWEEVPWTEKFVDLSGDDAPKPFYDTQVKLRWDNTHLYVAAYLQDKAIWANKTEHDSHVYKDNAFEIYVDVDGSTHNYKEIQINALGTIWDLMLTKAYVDGGHPLSAWESELSKAVLTDGDVNNPTSPNEFWTVEMALPFKALKIGTPLDINTPPGDKEIWRMVLARPQWTAKIENGTYVKDETVDAHWWSWQPHGVISLHLPDKWGLMQFSRDTPEAFKFTPSAEFPVREALFEAFRAMKEFFADYGMYTTDVDMLNLPPFIMTGDCVGKPEIYLNGGRFIVTIQSLDTALRPGHIRDDRLVWFGKRDSMKDVP